LISIDLLDFCDSENRSHIVESEKYMLESGIGTEFEEDLNIALGKNNSKDEEDDKQHSIDHNKDFKQDTDNESILSNENSDQDEDSEEVSENETDIKFTKNPTNKGNDIKDEDSVDSDTSKHSNDNKGLWEDIYGRQRDREGNIIATKYVPPAARIASTDIPINDEKSFKCEKQLKGILNRLAERNMHTIANQVLIII